jgi:hypothetical protein
MDHKQQIYEGGSNQTEIFDRLRIPHHNVTLLAAYRCCPYIVRLAAEFVDNALERQQFLQQHLTAQTEIETPLLYEALDAEDEKRRLIEILRNRLRRGERVAVLFPRKKQVFGYAKSLREAGLEVELQDEPDFTNEKPKLVTYQSAKGLTFDTVLLPRLICGAFNKDIPEGRIERLLYVGITRATNWVYMSTVVDQGLRALERVGRLSQLRQVTVQRGSNTSTVEPVMTSADDANFLVANGRKYGHILDPRTLEPSTSALSATIFSRDGTIADATSKAAFIMGPKDGLALADSFPGTSAVIAYRKADGTIGVAVSERLAGAYKTATR